MGKNRKIAIAKCAVIASAIPVLLYAYAEGPDPRKTGAPGDSLCTECHLGTAVNAGGGKVEVAFPGGLSYTPGVKQQWTVTVTDSQARRWGFQLTVRPASNESNGQAGDLSATDAATQVLCADGTRKSAQGCPAAAPLQFIEHTLAGTSSGTFSFSWTPPTTDVGPVKVWVAGNGANGNGQNTGDHIYTASYTLTPAGALPTEPTIISPNGVVNGATFQPGIAPSSWITIFGTNLATNSRIWRDDEIVNGKLPLSLDGVSVMVNNKPAAVYFISPGQINVEAPSDDSTGPVEVQVKTTQGTATSSVQLQTFSPGLFLFDQGGRKYAAAVLTDGTRAGRVDLIPGLTTRPVKPGEVVLLFGTGFGPTNPPVPSGEVFVGANPLVNTATVRIGNIQAEVLFAGMSGAGLYQFNVKVPDGVPDGDAPLVIDVAGTHTQDNVFLTVQR